MSTFDQRVCEWLNTASIPNEKKQLLLNRMSVGISNYRTLEIDPQRNPPSQMEAQAKVTAAKKPAPKRTSAGPTPRTPKTTGRSTSHVSSQAATSQAEGARSPSRTTNANSTIMPYAPPPTTVDVDYTLQQRIAKALRRLQEGDEGTSESPLFLVRPRIPRQQQQTASPTSATASASGTSFSGAVNTGRSTTGASGGLTDRDPQPLTGFGRAETGGTNNTDAPFTSDEALAPHSNENVGRVMPGFVFGSPPDPNFVSDEHDDVDQPTQDQVMTENEDIRRRNTMKRKSRNAISAETIDPAKAAKFTAAVVPKTEQMRKTILRGLETHHLFSFLDDDDLEFVANVMRIQTFHKGDNVVSKMDPCDEFHVLVEGSATVTDTTTADEYEENMLYGRIDDSNDGASPLGTAAGGGKRPSNALSASAMLEASGRTTGNLSPGATFGDLALMYESTSPETIQASSEPTVFCTLERTTYKNICTKASLAKRAQYEDFLSRISWLQGLTREERLRLADALKAAKYNKGDKIIRYGEEGVWFNIIVEGSVDVIGRDKNNNNCYVCSFQAGDCVGELEFLFNHKTVADCVAATDIVRTAKMTAKHFEKVIGPAKEILQRQAGESDVYAYYRQSQKK